MSDDRIIRIENKIDALHDSISQVRAAQSEHNTLLAVQNVQLADHIRRTEILEEAVIPLKKHDAMFLGVLKACGLIVGLAATIEGVVVLLTYIRH